jgi:hypothetical protein
MPLFGSASPRPQISLSSFVVGLEGTGEKMGAVIYKIQNRKEILAVFQTALLSGRFSQVVVFHSEKRLIYFLKNLESFDAYKIINIV